MQANITNQSTNESTRTETVKLCTTREINTYRLGPLSEENSQWNTRMCRFGLFVSTDGLPRLISTSSDIICSLV